MILVALTKYDSQIHNFVNAESKFRQNDEITIYTKKLLASWTGFRRFEANARA